MTSHTDVAKVRIQTQLQRFEEAISTMAWGIANQILEEHKKRLVSGLSGVVAKADTIKIRTSGTWIAEKIKQVNNGPSRPLRLLSLLVSKSGTWDRGGGAYRVIGPGEEPETFDLENIVTGKKINATLKTLISRWKHIP
jgi:hypothetical protein